jgi:signal transduction histidine kinase
MTAAMPGQHRLEASVARWLPPGIGARLLLLIALALLPMLLLLAWVYYQRYEVRRDQALQTELEVAQGVATIFDTYVTDIRREAFVVGQAIVIYGEDERARANRLLTVTAGQYATVTSMQWVSPQGRIIASSVPGSIGTNLGDRPYFQSILAGDEWAISDLLPQGRVTGQPAFVIAHSIRGEAGALQGVVVVGIDPAQLGEVTLTQRRPGGGAYAIFDREGTLIYRSPETAFTLKDRTQWRESDVVLRETLRTGEPATGVTRLEVVGGEWVSARVPIEPYGWVAGAGRPVNVTLTPIRKALVLDALLALLATALAFMLAWGIGRTISRPLRRLQSDVRVVGEGDLSHRAAVAGPAEVAQVAMGFNQMAEEIEEFQDTLEDRVQQRTAELEASNKELESFSYTVAHDLRSPLRALDGFSKFLLERYPEQLDERGAEYLHRIRTAAQRMGRLIDDLLNMARIGRMPIQIEAVNLSAMAGEIIAELRERDPERRVEVEIAPDLTVQGDHALLRIALANLLENAWKFTSGREVARISVGMEEIDGERAFFVRDNGVGFDMAYADKLFQPFHRLHTEEEFPGTGIGLALTQRIIARHRGRIWAHSAVGHGASFYFVVGD